MPELSSVFSFVNYTFVLFFGIVASLYLADINFCCHKRVYILTLFCFVIAQFVFYLIMGESLLYKCYPFLIHIPLIALIFLRFHRNLSISVIAVLSAYLLCTPRKWFGTFIAFFFDGNPIVSNVASILITIPLLFLVIRFISPYIIRLKYESHTTLFLFFLLPNSRSNNFLIPMKTVLSNGTIFFFSQLPIPLPPIFRPATNHTACDFYWNSIAYFFLKMNPFFAIYAHASCCYMLFVFTSSLNPTAKYYDPCI